MTATRKPPPGKPGPRAVGKPSDGDFTWTTASGVTFTVPSMSKMDPDMDAVAEYAEALDNANVLGNQILAGAASMRFLRQSLPPEPAAMLGKLKLSEFEAFVKSWSEHSGLTLGESVAS